MLDRTQVRLLLDHKLNGELLKGRFGLEKENVRIDGEGKLALTPHPAAFGAKLDNPYIQTDFSESQIEMITPAFASTAEAFTFLEALQDIVSLELARTGEWLWPSSNPPMLPDEQEIPLARMDNPTEDQYRSKLADKYGRKRQLLSGIHFNFSFEEAFLRKLHALHPLDEREHPPDFKTFKDRVYLKITRGLLRYRWLLVYLTGASPFFDETYMSPCVEAGKSADHRSYTFPGLNSLRNSPCGYRNEKPLYVSFDSVERYAADLERLVEAGELLSVKEFYSAVRLKKANGPQSLEALAKTGVDYLELRFLDLNPLFKTGVSLEILDMVHLFILYMLLKEDEPFAIGDQEQAAAHLDQMLRGGIAEELVEPGDGPRVTMKERGLAVLEEMREMVGRLLPGHSRLLELLEREQRKLEQPELTYAAAIQSAIGPSSYLDYHLAKAKQYAEESAQTGFRFAGFEDLELSTQLLLKAAVKRGIRFEVLDRADNFILLTHGEQREYIKQATKTSLDPYSAVLIMENKVVTKEVLARQGIRVPGGGVFADREAAAAAYSQYGGKAAVIKPKSTNFGLGITIFDAPFSEEEYRQALELAFAHDRTVLVEEFVAGKEYRFLVIGDEVVGVLHRVPAHVVGDGLHSVEALVEEKNKHPFRGEGYRTPLEKLKLGQTETMFLNSHGHRASDIPRAGETVYLRENSNISTGGDSIDYTDLMPERYKRLAVQAARAAGAIICGVDMMIAGELAGAGSNAGVGADASGRLAADLSTDAAADETPTDADYCIIELNFNPAIHIHGYPYQGENRHAEEHILNLLFGRLTP